MSQETDPSSGSPKNDSIRPSEGEPKKKLSLKEIAQRASQSGSMRPGPVSGGGRASQSDISASTKTPLPTGRSSTPSHPGSVPPRAVSTDKEDSGVVNLKVVQEAAAEKLAAEKLAAEKAQAEREAEAKAATTVPSKADLKVVASAPPAKKGSGGIFAGVAVAVLGLAAAFAIVQMNKPAATTTAAAPVQPEGRAAGQPAAAEAAKPAAAPDPAAPAAEAPAEAPAADAPEKVAAAGPAPAGGPAPAAGAAAANEAPDAPAEPVAANTPPAPAAPSKPGDLASAMQSAVGTTGKTTTSDAEPASGGRTGNQNVPEQPPQGAVNAAIRSGMGAAKACVAGADDVSRAQVTFGSSGAVKSVSVSGWAAGKSAAGCIKSAFKGTSVAPFSKPSFTVGFTIRP